MSSDGNIADRVGSISLFTPKTVFSLRKHNAVLFRLNPLLNMEIKRGGSEDKVTYSEQKTLLQLASDTASSTAIRRYRIRAAIAGDTSPVIQGDRLICRTWDGTTQGQTDVPVALPFLNRSTVASRIVDGITMTFTYAYDTPNTKWTRTAHVTTPSSTYDDETQILIPHYKALDEVIAVDMTQLGGTGIASVAWLDLNIDGRRWCSVPAIPPP